MQETRHFTLKPNSKILAAAPSNDLNHVFVVGSENFTGDSDISILQYLEEDHDVVTCSTFKHKPKISSIACNPVNRSIIATTGGFGFNHSVFLWNLSESNFNLPPPNSTLEECNMTLSSSFGFRSCRISKFQWRPSIGESSCSKMVLSDANNKIEVWETNGSTLRCTATNDQLRNSLVKSLHLDVNNYSNSPSTTVSWSGKDSLCFSFFNRLVLTDIRSMAASSTLTTAETHIGGISDLSISPKNSTMVSTIGCDGWLRVWDMRRPDSAVIEILAYDSSMGLSCQYNPTYPELILTSSFDGILQLYRMEDPYACLVSHYDDATVAGELLSCCCWTGTVAEPWVYASLGQEGKLSAHFVPSSDRYRITL